MNTIAPTLSFHDCTLFDVYRQQLEHVSNLGAIQPMTTPSPKPVTEQKEKRRIVAADEDMMLDNTEMEALINIDAARWTAPDPEITEKQAKHVALLEQQQKEQQQLQNKQDLYTKEYALLKQLRRGEDGPCLYDYTTEDIIETAAAHCDWLLENDIKVENMNNTNRLLRKNLEFELMCQDKRSTKIVALQDRFIDLALKGDVSSAELDALVARTYKIAQDPTNDKLLIKCSEPKKRGRTSDADRLKTLNVVDTLRKESITPRKVITGEPTPGSSPIEAALEAAETDKYKVFLEILKLVQDNALTKDNYGSYLEKMTRLIHTDVEWPMKTLMKSILNMEACIGINEIESIVIEAGEGPYYCSYSDDCIKTGDHVYHIRILEYSHERHKKWRILKNRPNREFESPEFLDSVRAFFIKKHHISLAGLWFRDFDEAYKAHHAGGDTKVPLPKRAKYEPVSSLAPRITTKQDGHIWRRVDYMRNYINEHNLEHKEVRGKTFANETKRIHTILRAIKDDHTLQTGLCDIIGAYYKEEGEEEMMMDEDTKMATINRLMYVVLDFIDLFYSVAACEDGTHRPLTERDTSNCVLRLLLDISYQRRNHPSYNIIGNEFDKINRESSDVNQYTEFSENNFLFLSIFDYLFPTKSIKKENEAIEVLQMFGL